MTDLFSEGFPEDIPLPFENDAAIIKYWGDNPIMGRNFEVDQWFTTAKAHYESTGELISPPWFATGASMNKFLDSFCEPLYLPQGWCFRLDQGDVDKIEACIRILRVFDPRSSEAVQWDISVVLEMFRQAQKQHAITRDFAHSILTAFKVLNQCDTVAAEIFLRYHAAKLGAEFNLCWMFLGTREHIYALTHQRWMDIPQHVLGSPAARKHKDGQVYGDDDTSDDDKIAFDKIMRQFLGSNY